MKRTVKTILKKLNIKYEEFCLLKKREVKRIFQTNKTEPDWRVNMIEELLNIRENQLECDLDQNEFKEILQYVCIFR